MKKTDRLVVFALLLMSWGCSNSKTESQQARPAASALPTVKVQVMKPELYREEIRLSGSLVASEAVQLSTEAAGRITYLNLREGEKVQAGEVLLRLNSDDLQAQLRKHEAVLAELKSREIRQKALLQREAISQQEYDQLQAEILVVEAERALTQAQIEKTILVAPFSGRVGLRYISQGAFLAQNSLVAELVNADPMYIDFAVPEKYASRVHNGMMLHYMVENLRDTFSARIVALAPRIDPDSRSLQLRAATANPSGKLIAGAFARIRLPLEEIPDALMLKNTAIVPDMTSKKVFVLRNGLITATTVESANREAEFVRIISGLSAGDTVVTSGILKVRPGVAVEILEVN